MERLDCTCEICDSEFSIEHDSDDTGPVCFCPFCGEQMFDETTDDLTDYDLDDEDDE